ncbi:MAG TPA: hypothetical protein VMU14_08185 [Acidimicrobiales bacterium]|nr:hypothetical protein [Acidimicrobiales bacterium]
MSYQSLTTAAAVDHRRRTAESAAAHSRAVRHARAVHRPSTGGATRRSALQSLVGVLRRTVWNAPASAPRAATAAR